MLQLLALKKHFKQVMMHFTRLSVGYKTFNYTLSILRKLESKEEDSPITVVAVFLEKNKSSFMESKEVDLQKYQKKEEVVPLNSSHFNSQPYTKAKKFQSFSLLSI